MNARIERVGRDGVALSKQLRRCGGAALAGSVLLIGGGNATAASVEREFGELAARCAPQIHLTTLSAVVMQESRANPFAIGINGGTAKLERQPRNRAEAIATAEWLKARGHNFDAGLGQINVKNMEWLGLRVADLFDPCANLRAAATVLEDCYSRASRVRAAGQPALRSALSCYNTGTFHRGFKNGYVAKVASRAGVVVPAVVDPRAPQVQSGLQGVPGEAPASGPPAERGFGARGVRSDAFSGPKSDAFGGGDNPPPGAQGAVLADHSWP